MLSSFLKDIFIFHFLIFLTKYCYLIVTAKLSSMVSNIPHLRNTPDIPVQRSQIGTSKFNTPGETNTTTQSSELTLCKPFQRKRISSKPPKILIYFWGHLLRFSWLKFAWFFRSSWFGGYPNFEGCLHAWGCLHFWGSIHLWGVLYFWCFLNFEVALTFGLS